MSLDIGDELGAFGDLTEAVGLTIDGELNGDWFLDPLGDETASPPGLASIVYSDHQRESLIAFVDEVLGAPDRTTDDGATWVPLFSDSGATVFAVVAADDGPARVGFGIEYETTGAAPTVAIRAHVPVFQLPRAGQTTLADTGSLPDWLVLGAVGGRIEIGAQVVISTASPTPGEAFLGGISVGLAIPTNPGDSFALDVELERLQLPGTTAPRDLALNVDSLADVGTDVLEFVVGILQAQADALDPSDPATAPFAALAALFGLRTTPGLPPFPLDDLLTSGANAAIAWIESIFTDDTSRDAWLAALADLVGGTPNAGRDAIEFTAGVVTGSVGVRVSPAAGGGITITPWVEVALRPRSGSEARLHADVLTADTTDASFGAVPALSATAAFGRDAGAASDLLDTP
uniref:hypothetical protein n=1 Tax=Ilumatobacter nonamiensis TaxID=467093 RepID=UPI0005911175